MAWQVLQSASTAAAATAGTTVSTTYPGPLSLGTVMIAAVGLEVVTGTTTVTGSVADSAGNAFTLIGHRAQPTSNNFADTSLWALATPSNNVGTNKPGVTATLGANTARMAMVVQEVSGILASADGTIGVTGGNTTGATGSPSYTSSASSEYLVSVYGDDGGPLTWTAPVALTADPASLNLQSHADIAIAYGNSTHGTEAGSWSLSGTAADWGVLLVAFKLAPVVPAKGMLATLFP